MWLFTEVQLSKVVDGGEFFGQLGGMGEPFRVQEDLGYDAEVGGNHSEWSEELLG